MSAVLYEHDGDGVAHVILNRPERKNAISGPLGQDLAAAMQRASDDGDVRVVVLRGAGDAFCSGLDLKAFNTDPAPAWLADFQSIWRGAHNSLFNCPKPVVAALQRYAINGGAALALAADLLIVGEDAFLQVGESQLGMAAPYNLAWLNLRYSEALIARLVIPGERWNGQDLAAAGVAHRCVPDAEVLATTLALAAQLAGYPEGGLQQIKAGMRARLDVAADDWFDRFTAGAGGRPPPKMPGRSERE